MKDIFYFYHSLFIAFFKIILLVINVFGKHIFCFFHIVVLVYVIWFKMDTVLCTKASNLSCSVAEKTHTFNLTPHSNKYRHFISWRSMFHSTNYLVITVVYSWKNAPPPKSLAWLSIHAQGGPLGNVLRKEAVKIIYFKLNYIINYY